MKFYRLFLLAIVCVMAFIAGWTIRGNYLSAQDSDLNLNPIFKGESKNRFPILLNKQKELDSKQEGLKKEKTIHKNFLETKDSISNNDLSLKGFDELKLMIGKRNSKQMEKDKEMVDKQKEHDATNRKYLLSIPNNNLFFLKGEYSFLVNVFSEEEKALKYIKLLREKRPLWNFFLKLHRGGVKIYLGPFKTKQKANNFMRNISKRSLPFPNYFLEIQSL